MSFFSPRVVFYYVRCFSSLLFGLGGRTIHVRYSIGMRSRWSDKLLSGLSNDTKMRKRIRAHVDAVMFPIAIRSKYSNITKKHATNTISHVTRSYEPFAKSRDGIASPRAAVNATYHTAIQLTLELQEKPSCVLTSLRKNDLSCPSQTPQTPRYHTIHTYAQE